MKPVKLHKYLLFTLMGFALIQLLACRNDCENRIKLDEYIKSYIQFTEGKYWILENKNGDKDTLRVVNSAYQNGTTYDDTDCKTEWEYHKIMISSTDSLISEFEIKGNENAVTIDGILSEEWWLYNFDFKNIKVIPNRATSNLRYIKMVDTAYVNNNIYLSNISVGRIFNIYDSLTFSPNVGIILYHKNDIKYELIETN